tara:strand:- start:207 stop:548 length:342 start_codon:yes stop_codon:yes gene_type:complete
MATLKKTKVEYKCDNCNYMTHNKKDYKRHLKTKKHLRGGGKIPKPTVFTCEICNRDYKSNAALYKHKQNCEYIPETNYTNYEKKLINKIFDQNKIIIEQNSEILKILKNSIDT